MVKLITVVTHDSGYLKWLEESCKRYNVNLIKLGWGQKWQGFAWRFTLMINYLKSIDKDELVIFIDAYDVLLLRPLDDIEETFNSIIKISNKKIIISCENNNNALLKLFGNMQFGQCKSLGINAGTYMGRAKDLLDIYNKLTQDVNFKNNDDDQVLFTTMCNNNNDLFYIDSDHNIFLIAAGLFSKKMSFDGINIDKNKKLTFNNSTPYFIHAPGNTLMDDLIKKLGYNITNDDINNNYYNSLSEKIKKFKYYNNKFSIIIILIIIFLIYWIFYKNKI